MSVDADLATYACHPQQSRGRHFPELEHVYRTCFQRDRDRITHCSAFRRLEYKTQVFSYAESDYVRTRLTHTLEVSQIARSLARALHLNEDLTEAIALSHDLGHPPFGHAGETILDQLTKAAGGFNHNIQGLRIVEVLEERYGTFPGLNLTFEVREAFAKHGSGRRNMPSAFAGTGPQPILEAQIVDLADELAYTIHDIDDGITHQRLRLRDLATLDLWERPFGQIHRRFPSANNRILRYETTRHMIDYLVTDAINTTLANIKQTGIQHTDDLRHAQQPMAAFSEQTAAELKTVKNFLFEKLYHSPQVLEKNQFAQTKLAALYHYLSEQPHLMPQRFQDFASQYSLPRAIADYIAGMTDKFAIETVEKFGL